MSIDGKIKNNKPANMPESMPANMNAGNAENIRENLWVYRVYNGLSRYEMADGITKPGQYRSYEYGFQPVPDKHLAAFADTLGVSIDALAAPPDFSAVLNWQMRKMMEYYRNMNDNHRYLIKNLMRSMGRNRV
ncbi:MAG: hypothetical protein GWP33_03880 [Alphaproteobacteria bacterium]|nr:hypothetical protein [Alphaproteobacteria bacterium]